MIERCDLLPYRLPLRQPWRSARGSVAERHGWLVRMTATGRNGFGDCSPLPAAGTELPEQAAAALTSWQAGLVGRSPQGALAWLADHPTPAPAARFAIESALLDLLAQARGLALRFWLTPEANDRVAVNTMLGGLDAITPEAIETAGDAGFRVLKVKIGLAEPNAELARLQALAGALPPSVRLRLDANGAWTMVDATRFLDVAAALPIEAIEEPLREPRSADLRTLQARAPFPLALDESLQRPDFNAALVGDPSELPVRRLVLKPAVIGGLQATRMIAERAIAVGLEVVVTSLIESAAGLWPTAQLAASLPGQPAHGLATAVWLRRDLGEAPRIEHGEIVLPERPGSGFRPSAQTRHAAPGETLR
ncbi:o-succinylbenzoic acid synthetase [Thioflavicoccus mobilis 8321]|uniref:o-succinylbenzoate synthase n=1 Tax=Thioflavicoccus mobilis 8321 TaxID=765912 RepID=L0H1T4_9GAMM|nr:o-succinylbenzoate synthase [Thioflavicoccus mobilis]AGA91987.1 o-succinylbenzoic acid synthetase [Thioflavicoccus mobilis 8321]